MADLRRGCVELRFPDLDPALRLSCRLQRRLRLGRDRLHRGHVFRPRTFTHPSQLGLSCFERRPRGLLDADDGVQFRTSQRPIKDKAAHAVPVPSRLLRRGPGADHLGLHSGNLRRQRPRPRGLLESRSQA